MDTLYTALTRLAIKHPFIASAALRMKWIADEDIPTLATDGNTVYLNDAWVGSLNIDEQMFCIAHESLHAMLHHCPMIRRWVGSGTGPDGQAYDSSAMNRAMDFLINGSLVKEGFRPPVLPNDGKVCHDKKWDLSSDLVTVYLEVKEMDASTQRPLDDHRQAKEGEPPSISSSDVKAASHTARALSSGRDSDIARAVMTLVEPAAASPWEILHTLISRSGVATKSSWSRPNRHMLVRGIIAPGLVSESAPPLAVVVDVSGSCHGRVKEFLTHVASIAVDVKPERVLLVFADNRVIESKEYDSAAELSDALQGMNVPYGGTTDMCVGIDFAKKNGYNTIVIMTDGDTPFPLVSTAHLIWAITTSTTPPIGDVVRI